MEQDNGAHFMHSMHTSMIRGLKTLKHGLVQDSVLPVQVTPSSANVKPAKQVQEKEPFVFKQDC